MFKFSCFDARKREVALIFFSVIAFSFLMPSRALLEKDAFTLFVQNFYEEVCVPLDHSSSSASRFSLNVAKRKKYLNFDNAERVVLIVLESTNAKATTIYNPLLLTTPFLNQLASQSVVYTKAHAVVPHTSKALVSMLCGIYPDLTAEITEGAPGVLDPSCIAEPLKSKGVKTVFFQSATKHFEDREKLVKNMRFDEFYSEEDYSVNGFERANYFGYEDDVMLAKSDEWLEKNKTEKFFAVYLTNTPHTPYLAPKRYGHRKYVDDVKKNRYLNSINYLDNFVKNLISQYKEVGLYNETLFVVVGDHGEGFGEHGRMIHDDVIYEEGLHVPLLIHKAGAMDNKSLRNDYVSTMDIAPTVLQAFGGSDSTVGFDGVSLFDVAEDRDIFSSCLNDKRCVSLITDGMKYIHHFGIQPDEFFDLNEDPLEINNVISIETEGAAKMKQKVLDIRQTVKQRYSAD